MIACAATSSKSSVTWLIASMLPGASAARYRARSACRKALSRAPSAAALATARELVETKGGGAMFDDVSWLDAANAATAWDAVAWRDGWADGSWSDVSWSDVSWSDVSWTDAPWWRVFADSGDGG